MTSIPTEAKIRIAPDKTKYSYRFRDNFIYHAHPLVKFILFMLLVPFTFLYWNPFYLAMLFLNLMLIANASEDLSKIMRFVKLTVYFGFFLFIINILLRNDGETSILYIRSSIPLIKDLNITVETMVYSTLLVFQLLIVMLIFALINNIISPDELLSELRRMHFPYIMTFLIVLSVRFFSVLLDDLESIGDVQRTRGVELDKGNLTQRIRNRIVLILPLLTNSLERSIQVSEALEARGFGVKQERSVYNRRELTKMDYVLLFMNLCIYSVLFYYRLVGGFGNYETHPLITWPSITLMDLILVGLLFFINIITVLIWKITAPRITATTSQSGGTFAP